MEVLTMFKKAFQRAFEDAKDASSGGSDDTVSKKEFRLLLVYIRLYSTMFEVFGWITEHKLKDIMKPNVRITAQMWINKLQFIKEAGRTWAYFRALKTASAPKFAEIDRDRSGLDLNQFCHWIEGWKLLPVLRRAGILPWVNS